LRALVDIAFDVVAARIVVTDVINRDRLFNALEKAADLPFHTGRSETTASTEHHAQLLRDRTHRSKYGSLFTPQLAILRLILPILAPVRVFDRIHIAGHIVPDAHHLSLSQLVNDPVVRDSVHDLVLAMQFRPTLYPPGESGGATQPLIVRLRIFVIDLR